MKIAIAVDHAGYSFKSTLIDFLIKEKHTPVDCGCSSEESCDYPDYSSIALKKLVDGEVERAILCCGNGIGMSIAANKTRGAIASMVYSETSAADTRAHHDSNVLCLGVREFSQQQLLNFTKIWLETSFQNGRHLRRINKVKSINT